MIRTLTTLRPRNEEVYSHDQEPDAFLLLFFVGEGLVDDQAFVVVVRNQWDPRIPHVCLPTFCFLPGRSVVEPDFEEGIPDRPLGEDLRPVEGSLCRRCRSSLRSGWSPFFGMVTRSPFASIHAFLDFLARSPARREILGINKRRKGEESQQEKEGSERLHDGRGEGWDDQPQLFDAY